MQGNNFEIQSYNDNYKEQILAIWEKSVRATHYFLIPSDFDDIKQLVHKIDFNSLEVICLVLKKRVIGFIGVDEQKIEMLFLDPKYFGQGLGSILVNYAIKELSANRVDVNEQNVKAIGFYQKQGFEIFERTEMDEQGRKYPLVRMQLKSKAE